MKVSDRSRIYAALVLILAILGLGIVDAWVMSPFIAAIAWAIVLAVAFQGPWNAWQRRWPRWPNLGAGALTAVIGLLVLLPAIILLSVVAGQVNKLIQEILTRLNTSNVKSFSDLIQLPAMARLLDSLKDHLGMTPDDFQRLARGFIQRSTDVLPGLSAKLAISVFDGLVTFLMSLFLLFFFLRDGESMATSALDILPTSEVDRRKLGQSVGTMLKAIFRGSLLCALAQGALGGLGWWMAGLPLPALAGAAMGALSLLPLGGTAILWIPGTIWAWTSGHHGAATFLFIWSSVVTTFLADNILRPFLIRGSEELSTLVVILGVFGGMAAFGLLGVFIGPIALALGVSLLEVLRSLARESYPEPIQEPESPQPPPGEERP